MPQLIGAALVQLGVSTAVAAVAAYAVTIGASVAISDSQRRKAQRKARDAYNASLRDRIINLRSAIAPRELVVGRVRKGGPVLFFGSTGVHKEKFSVVIALAAHEIDGVEAPWLNDERQTLDAAGYVVGGSYCKVVRHSESEIIPDLDVGESTTITLPHDPVDGQGLSLNHLGVSVSGRVVTITNNLRNRRAGGRLMYQWDEVQPKARIRWHKGAGVDALHDEISARFPAEWTAEHKLEGIAYALAEFDYDEEIFAAGVPTLSLLLRGDPNVEDPRTNTTGYTENPALLARHVAMHQLGGRLPAAAISTPHCIAAANECDAQVTYTVAGVDQVRPLYTAGLVHACGTRPVDTIAELIEAMAGSVGYAGGGIVMRAGTYTPPVFNITERHMLTGLEIQPEALRDDTYNLVTGTFIDSATGWAERDMPTVAADEWIAADGEELPLEVEYAGIFHVGQAQHVSAVKLRDARQSLTVKGTFDLAVFPVELLDTVSITSDRRGWAAKPFLVLHRAWNADGKIDLVLKETGASIYSLGTSFSAVDAEPNTALPSPMLTERPQPLAAASGSDQLLLQSDGRVLSRVRVSWPPAVAESVRNGGSIEVAYTRADEALPEGDWPSTTVPGAATSALLMGLQDGAEYLIRARYVTALARWPWGVQIVHQVLGKTAPPSDLSGLDADDDAVRWTHVTDADVVSGGGYELRWQTGTNAEWESAQPLHSGLLTSSPYRWTVRPTGPITLLAKAVDSSGNRSRNAAVAYITLTTRGVRNVVATHAYAPGFAGIVAAGTVTAGVLEADVNTLAYAEPARFVYGQPDAEFYAPAQFGGVDYISAWWTPPGALDGDALLLLYAVAGATGLQIEYQADAGLAFGPPAGAAFGSAGEPFYEGGAADWITWPGLITAKPAASYRWRVRTQSGATQAQLSLLTAYLDAPYLEEVVPLTAIAAPGGTRLPLTKAYRGISAVVPGLVVGSTAVTVETQDLNATLGPLVVALDSSRIPVAASATAVIKGY